MKKSKIIAIVLAVAIGFSVPFVTNTSKDDEGTLVKAEVPVAAYAAATEPTTENTKVTEQSTITTKSTFKQYTMYVKVGTANVRSGPSKNNKVVKTYHKGKKLTILQKKGDWRRIGKNLWINKSTITNKDPMGTYKGVKLKYNGKYNVCKSPLTRRMGVKYFQDHKETYYSQKVLPGNGLKIPGRHVADDGTIRDKDGYIVVSCNYIKYGSKIMTSLGPAKRYDCGDMTGKWIDIYVNW